ncbi:MAG: M56 family metallopeptidase [Gemmatimonadota bacterium]
MLLLWMASTALVTALVVGAALLLERAVTARRRWLWFGALLVGAGLPVLRPLLGRLLPAASPLEVAFGPILPAVRGVAGQLDTAATAAGFADATGILLGAWIGVSVVLIALVSGGVVRMRRLSRGWRPRALDGMDVLLSEALGPAVVGLFRPRIVLPAWVVGLDPDARALILAHEEEHRRGRDPLLLTAALLVPVAMPWNPGAWLAFFRLRDAVETDCDARVLARGRTSARSYARLLYEVGSRPAVPVPLGAGFGERTSSLERRIRIMLGKTLGIGWRGWALRGGVAAALVAVACTVDVTLEPRSDDSAGASEAPTAPSPRVEVPDPTVAGGPSFTPFTVAPAILNRDEVVTSMEKEYPPLLRDAGVGGTVKVYFFINASGRVEDTRIDESSGHPALDQAALRVAHVYRFSPALNKDEKVSVWVSFPITFQVR